MNAKEEIPYFKLSTNEFGKHWLFYNPLKDEPGKYGCWMPIDDEFYNEFKKLQNSNQTDAPNKWDNIAKEAVKATNEKLKNE